MSKKRIIRKAGLSKFSCLERYRDNELFVYGQEFEKVDNHAITLIPVKPADRGKRDALDSLKREIAILKKVDHPNVVKLYEVCRIINASKLLLDTRRKNIFHRM